MILVKQGSYERTENGGYKVSVATRDVSGITPLVDSLPDASPRKGVDEVFVKYNGAKKVTLEKNPDLQDNSFVWSDPHSGSTYSFIKGKSTPMQSTHAAHLKLDLGGMYKFTTLAIAKQDD